MALSQNETKHKPRFLVPGSPARPGYGSGRSSGREEAANNHRDTEGCQRKGLTLIGRSFRLDYHLEKLEVELNRINWHILGFSGLRREGDDAISLEFGH